MLEQRILYSSLLSSICLAMMYYFLMIQWPNPVTDSHSDLDGDGPGYVSLKGHTVPKDGPLPMQYMHVNDRYALCHLARVTNVNLCSIWG